MILTEEPRFTHAPVLLNEVVDLMVTDPHGLYLDATLGLGGHSQAILKALSPDGRVLGIDADPEAIESARWRLKDEGPRFLSVLSNFRNIPRILQTEKFHPLSGALFDLGVSSLQLDKPERGFSFRFDGPLDMRLGQSGTLTAAEIVNRWPVEQLSLILDDFGEEREASKIARSIVARRAVKPFATTRDLANFLESILPRGEIHPATRTFQALRIAVNEELDTLRDAMDSVFSFLKTGGRVGVISFHSLEDRIVKNVFSAGVARGIYRPCGPSDVIRPTSAEIALNARARSAKLRVIEIIKGGQRS